MFVDFDKVLKKAKDPEAKLPKALVDYLSKSLPKGFEYEQIDDGICSVVPKNNKLPIGGWMAKLTEHQREILGSNFTYSELCKYLYNSQTSLEIIPSDGTNITLNGEKFPMDNMFISPKNPSKKLEIKSYINPAEFPEPQQIELSYKNITRKLLFQRIANDSINEIIFETLDDEPIKLRIILDDRTLYSTISMSLNTDTIESVSEMINSMALFNAFMKGKLFIQGHKLLTQSNSDKPILYPNDVIVFWEKILQIEKHLELNFNISNKNIDYQTECIIEKLYQCLINKVPIKDNYKVDSVNGCWNLNDDKDKSIGKPIFIILNGHEDFELFEQKFSLPCSIALFNSVLKDFQRTGEETKLLIDDEGDDKKRYTSTLLFKTDEELSKFDPQNHIEEFKNAKSPTEYI